MAENREINFGGSRALKGILPYLPPGLREEFSLIPPSCLTGLEEIRLRLGFPIALRFNCGEAFLAQGSRITQNPENGRVLSPQELRQIVLLISDSSFYALEEELKRGYITLRGGHRAGLCGRAVLDGGNIRTLKDISSINLRLARFVAGNGEKLLPRLYGGEPKTLQHTLIASPPGAGKTTLLRDLAGLLSKGHGELSPNIKGAAYNVGIVDERSEIAAMLEGKPQLPLGPRCDVLDACPKGEGMMLMIRSMAPQIIICDEIGRIEDATAIREASNAGIIIIASAHGSNKEELLARPVMGGLLKEKAFGRIVFLSRAKGPGTIESIWDCSLNPLGNEEPGNKIPPKGKPFYPDQEDFYKEDRLANGGSSYA